MSVCNKLCVLLAIASFASVATAQTSNVKPERIRGDIVSMQGDILKVHRRSGDTASIEIKPDVTVSALKPIALADVKAGTYVGVPALAGTDGKMTATAVLVFPDAARGANEGHFAYDFGSNSTMTNANVDTVVTGTSGRNLSLSYKGGSNTVNVPENVPVVTFAPATRADLVAGKQVVVVVTPAGKDLFDAHILFVEKDGVVPPL